MFTETITQGYLASVLIPKPCPKMHWSVQKVDAIGDLTLRVVFLDGVTGVVRFEESYLEGVFEVLKNPEFFKQVSIEYGAVTWPSELDLAPDAMYDEIKKNGEWILR